MSSESLVIREMQPQRMLSSRSQERRMAGRVVGTHRGPSEGDVNWYKHFGK